MNWDLAKRSTKCAGCQRTFDSGERYNTALFTKGLSQETDLPAAKTPFEETGNRLDYCPECWEKMCAEKAHDFSWKGRIVEEDKEPKLPLMTLNRAELLALLREHLEASVNLPDENERVWKNGVAYFIALLMERKRWLTHKNKAVGAEDKENNDIHTAVYEDPKSKESFLIKYPFLHNKAVGSNLQAYQEEIARLLNRNMA